MEEADALCQRIGIMAKGVLRCLGTPLHLKNKLGKGYHLTVNFSQALEPDALQAQRDGFAALLKHEVCPGAVEKDTFKGQRVLSVFLPTDGLQVGRVFDLVKEERLKEHSIEEWSLAQTSLNDVFLRIAQESGHEDTPGHTEVSTVLV
jgi:ABC-type multidrug transport system ATPase subunit